MLDLTLENSRGLYCTMLPRMTKWIFYIFLFISWTSMCVAQEVTRNDTFCNEIGPIPYGDVIPSSDPPFKVGSVLVFRCDRGFKAHGQRYITCLSTGRWSHPAPYCQTTFCQRNEKMLEEGRRCRKPCTKESDCKGQFKKCRCDDWCGMSCYNPDAECPLLKPLINGYITGSEISYGRTVTYGCDDGYVLDGRSTRRCLSTRTWSGSAPKCHAYNLCGKISERLPSAGNVVSGADAKLGAWPWHALLFFNSDHDVSPIYDKTWSLGGGSVIDKKWILTAAHNFGSFHTSLRTNKRWENEFLIALGITSFVKDGQEIPEYVHIFEPSKVYRHLKFVANTYDYDVALIRIGKRLKREKDKFVVDSEALDGEITFTRYIRPVCLPCMKHYPVDSSKEWWENFESEKCTQQFDELTENSKDVWITGFGYTKHPENDAEEMTFKPDTLQEGVLSIWEDYRCAGALRELTNYFVNARYTGRMFCGGTANESINVDGCRGDSGGPIVKQIQDKQGDKYWIELGIVSWGWKCGNHLPGFYAQLPSLMSWVVNEVSGKRTDEEGKWTNWNNWEECDLTCSGGRRIRRRSCSNADCEGASMEEISCSNSPCLVTCKDGFVKSDNGKECVKESQWQSRGSWGICDRTCGGGNSLRRRSCDNAGQMNCSGSMDEKRACNSQKCPRWGSWKEWAQCTVSCGTGVQVRTRTCITGGPGDKCPGGSERTKACYSRSCPSWSAWIKWGKCDVTCGRGVQIRTRTCQNGNIGMEGCELEKRTETRACNGTQCPPRLSPHDPSFQSVCSVTCGGGVMMQRRPCAFNTGGCGSKPSEEVVLCATNPCPDTCNDRADIVFVLDSSSGIGVRNFAVMRMFVQAIVRNFEVGPTKSLFGAIRYNENVDHQFNLGDFSTRQGVLNAISAIPYDGSGTKTGKAINYTRENMFTAKAGHRPGVPKIVVLITDGISFDDVSAPSSLLKGENTVIIAVGIGNIRIIHLYEIATDPDKLFATTASDFDALEKVVKVVSNQMRFCEQEQVAIAPCPPQAEMDLMFILHSSNSIGLKNFELVKKFITNVVGKFNVGHGAAKFGIVRFNRTPHTEFNLGDHNTSDALVSAIKAMRFSGNGASIGKAINHAIKNSFSVTAGRRPGSSLLVVVLTSQKSADSVLSPARSLKSIADTVIAIGVGNYDKRQMRVIASTPVATNTLELEDFTQLNSFINRFTTTVCFGAD